MRKRIKKVALIIHGLHGGGAEKVAAELMNRLAENYKVTAIFLEKEEPRDYYLSPKVEKKFFLWELRPEMTYIDYQDPELMEYFRVRDIGRFRLERKFDCVISFLETGNFLNVLSRGAGRTYISIRNLSSQKMAIQYKSEPQQQQQEKWLKMKMVDRFARAVICVSQDVAEDVVKHYRVPRRKTRVIYNWLDADWVVQRAQETPDDPNFYDYCQRHDFLFVASGRMNIQKGQWHLIRAFASLHRENPSAGLILLGDGWGEYSIKESLMQDIERFQLKDEVYLCGWQRNPHSYMKAADAFVLSSLYEGFSNTALEAMALGLPAICDDCAGTRELLTPNRPYGEEVHGVVHGDYGVVTPRLDTEWNDSGELNEGERFLYEAMKEMLEDSELRKHYRQKGLERVKDFAPDVIMRDWIRVVEGKRRR